MRPTRGPVAPPVEVVVEGDPSPIEVHDDISTLQALTIEDGRFGPATIVILPANEVTVLNLPLEGDTVSRERMTATRNLLTDYIPKALTTGGTAVFAGARSTENADFDEITPTFFFSDPDTIQCSRARRARYN